jgi:hypothetical protein
MIRGIKRDEREEDGAADTGCSGMMRGVGGIGSVADRWAGVVELVDRVEFDLAKRLVDLVLGADAGVSLNDSAVGLLIMIDQRRRRLLPLAALLRPSEVLDSLVGAGSGGRRGVEAEGVMRMGS